MATGTGDVIFQACGFRAGFIRSAVGIDISEGMLAVGREKVIAEGLSDKVNLVEGDATCLDVESGSVDVVTISFGIRNVEQVDAALSEMYRVLKPSGRLLILEFSTPSFFLFRWGHALFLRFGIPLIGRLVAGEKQAFSYLHTSILAFPSGVVFCDRIRSVGFEAVFVKPMMLGGVSLYVATK